MGLLSLAIWLPIACGVVLLALGRDSNANGVRWMALVGAIASFLVTLPLVSGFDTRDLVTQVCAQPGGYSWQVLNRKIALKELAISGAEFNPSVRDKRMLGFVLDIALGNRWLLKEVLAHSTDVVTAASLDELAAGMNALQGTAEVSAQTLREVVDYYDRRYNIGYSEQEKQDLTNFLGAL